MLPAANKGVGMNMGFPDVCNTPVGPATVPIPYPNIGMNAQAAPFALIVKVTKIAALNLTSKITMTSGDEPGVAHPTVKGMGAYTMGNPIVFIEKVPGIMLTAPTTGNNMNNAVGVVAVPSAVNVLYTQRPSTPTDGLGEQEALTGPPIAATQRSGQVGYLKVRHFSSDLPAAVFNTLRDLAADDAITSLVIDLRGCPGGELSAAVELCDEFLPVGAAIVTVTDQRGDETHYRARHRHCYPHRLVLLVDALTASAAEVFSGSLQHHGRALVVGEPTYGKGTAQCYTTGDDGRHYATVANCRLPGSDNLAFGVQPDHTTTSSPRATRLFALRLAATGECTARTTIES